MSVNGVTTKKQHLDVHTPNPHALGLYGYDQSLLYSKGIRQCFPISAVSPIPDWALGTGKNKTTSIYLSSQPIQHP